MTCQEVPLVHDNFGEISRKILCDIFNCNINSKINWVTLFQVSWLLSGHFFSSHFLAATRQARQVILLWWARSDMSTDRFLINLCVDFRFLLVNKIRFFPMLSLHVKIPTTRIPNMIPMILGVIIYSPGPWTFAYIWIANHSNSNNGKIEDFIKIEDFQNLEVLWLNLIYWYQA